MINIFINTIIVNLVIFSFGLVCSQTFLNEKITKDNVYEIPLFGIIFLSFVVLIINFFFPINKIVGSLILIFGIINIILITYKNIHLLKKIFKNIIIASFISYLIISFSNVYRPDAGLYHLPFISLINENKIIFGSVNINFRYATTSIIQYLSASQNNYLFDLRSISIPVASIFSFSILFMIKQTFESLKNKENKLNTIIFLLITCYSFISFGRFSNYGNDTVSHIYFFLLIIFLVKNFDTLSLNILNFYKLSFITIFLFATKAFMLFIMIIPLYFFIINKNKKKFFKNRTSYILTFLLLVWIFRNIIISGCVIYPIEKTCFKNLKYFDQEKTILEAKSGEAWSKDWINQKYKKLSFEEYNKEFNWFKTWRKIHLKKILEKISPFLFFLFIIFLVMLFQKRDGNQRIDNNIKFIFLISILYSFIWFLKFPLYRYGSAFLASTIIVLFIIILNFLNLVPALSKLKLNLKLFIFICCFAFITKNFLRIINNIDLNYNQWPDIYSEKNTNEINNFELIEQNNDSLFYFSGGKLCMYSKSPCSNFKTESLKKESFFSYNLYFKN